MDDEENIVHYLTKLFELRGLEAFGATTAQKALEIFDKEKPEICILDIFLVDSIMDGVDVLREIRQKNKDTMCIMFTRITDNKKIDQAHELGIFDFLLKPLDSAKLKEVVASAAVLAAKQRGETTG